MERIVSAVASAIVLAVVYLGAADAFFGSIV